MEVTNYLLTGMILQEENLSTGTLSSFHLTGSTVATLNGTTGSNGSFEETTNKSEEKDEEASKSLKASVAFSIFVFV